MIFRLRDFIGYPISIKRFHNMLLESQYWTPEKRRGWIQENLERTLSHAVNHVPYYKKTLAPFESRFTEMIDRLDVSELPLITKETVRNHYKELCADNCRQYRPVPTHTSGSTGTPAKFLLDRESNIFHFSSIWRMLNWTGYRFGDRFADLTGHIMKNNGLFEYDIRLNCLHLSSFNFKKENIPQYVERLRRFNPFLIKAYPSAIDLFCRWLRELGLRDYCPQVVLTCAESLLDHQKLMVEETLHCTVFDFYNQNERAALISTCENHTYHIHEEYSYVEVVKANGSFSQASQTGGIVATTLHNFSMPLIRYQTDDLAGLRASGSCACGRTYRTMGPIVGRIEDVIVTPDGRHVGRLDAAFKYCRGIRLSQIVQETAEEICVKIVRCDAYSKNDEETLEHELRARLGDGIRIRFDYVESIPPERNGKLKFVISRPGREALQRSP